MMKLKCLLSTLLILIFSGSAFAQQIQTIPITPQYQLPAGTTLTQPSIQGQQLLPQQTQPQPMQPAIQKEVKPSEEKPSEFEQYTSDKAIEITEFQLEILKRFEGITFQYSATNLPEDKVAVPINSTV